MNGIAARVRSAYARVPVEDAEHQTVKVNPFVAANLLQPTAGPETRTKIPGTSDAFVNQGWSESPDGHHAVFTSEFGYVTLFPLECEVGSRPRPYPEVDLSEVSDDLFIIYAVPNSSVPAVMRGMFEAGFAPSSHEPCYTWIAPEDIAGCLKDRAVLDDLAARGRLRSLTADDVPAILKTW
jgi:hypothetical protein